MLGKGFFCSCLMRDSSAVLLPCFFLRQREGWVILEREREREREREGITVTEKISHH